jgi:hypothetical protein
LMPSICRSRRKLFSNSAKTPNIDKNALPAAVLVSIGCSVAFSLEISDLMVASVEQISESGCAAITLTDDKGPTDANRL